MGWIKAPTRWPMLFVQHMTTQLDDVETLRAYGVTQGINLYEVLENPGGFDLRPAMRQLKQRGLRCLVQIRWPNPSSSQHELAPTTMQRDDAMAVLDTQFGSDEALELTGATVAVDQPMLWCSIGVEGLNGGPGYIPSTERDGMFEWYEQFAIAMRADHPGVKLASMSFTGTALLNKTNGLTEEQTYRRETMLLTMALIRDRLDAVAVNPNAESASKANESMVQIDYYNRNNSDPLNGKYMVWPEFGVNDWLDRTDVKGAAAELDRVVRVAANWGVYWAGYRPGDATPNADPDDAERFTWTALTDENGDPNDDFFDAYQRCIKCARRRHGLLQSS